MQREPWLSDLRQDLRIAVRGLLRAPALAVTILLTVGLGIGATTVIFAAVDAALLRPLPYRDPDRLAWIYLDTPPFMFRFSLVDYQALVAQQTHFEGVAAFTDRSMSFSPRGSVAELLRGRAVSWSYFGVLGITPSLGRDFTEADGRPGPPALIVSHTFWQQRLGARRDVIGETVTLDGADHTLVGVLPPLVSPLERRQEFFIALQSVTPTRRGPFSYWVVGRLRPGVSADAAASELHTIPRRIFPIWRSSYQDERATWSLIDLKQRLVGNVQTTASLALGAVALVWIIACVNASNLLIARVASRRRELSVRTALGASRARVLRHLLAESALLAVGSALVGVALAAIGIDLLRDVAAAYFPRTQEIALDGSVLPVLAALTLVSTLIFGLIPALHGLGTRPEETLHAVERFSTGTRATRRLRQALVGTQYAIATPLLVTAALLLLSLNALRNVDLGFDAHNLISGTVRLPAALYNPGAAAAYWGELERRAAALPGVAAIAFADSRPPNTASNINNFDLEDAPTPAGDSQPATPFVAVSPRYFRVLGLEVLEGRVLDERDAQPDTLLSVVVDHAWATRFFPRTSALGKRFRQGGCTECPWTTVVGIVADVKFTGLDQPNQGTVYTPLPPSLTRFALVRSAAASSVALSSLRQAVRELDPSVPLTELATMDELIDQSLQSPRALSWLVGAFATMAVLLSVVGIYGVMAFYVQQHAKDISIRLALGGSAGAVLRMIVQHGVIVAGIGVGAGLVLTLAATRLIATLLFGIATTELTTYAAVVSFLVLTASIACVLPARSAVRAEPARVLRGD
jgi:putative ABC transport system permease protein